VAIFFSRPEAQDRHEKSPPEECFNVSPAKAEEKRTVTLKIHEGFKRELDAYLTFGGKMGEPFAQRIIKLYPDSSKRIGSKRDEWRLHRYDTVCLSFPFFLLLVPLRGDNLQRGDGDNFHVYVLAVKSCIAPCLLFRHCLYTKNHPDLT